MDDIGDELVWRMRALAYAKRARGDDPALSSQTLAHAIIRNIDGAPDRRDPVLVRIRAWERTGAIPPKRRTVA